MKKNLGNEKEKVATSLPGAREWRIFSVSVFRV